MANNFMMCTRKSKSATAIVSAHCRNLKGIPIVTNPLRMFLELLRQLMRIERHTAVSLRNQGRLNDEVLRRIEHELDLGEMRLSLME